MAFAVLLVLAIVLVPGIRLAHADTPVFTIGDQSDDEGTAVSLTLTATEAEPPFTYALTSGSLPSGLSLEGDTISGQIDNDAAQGGTNGVYSITINATDSHDPGDSTAASFTWTVTNPVPIINAIDPQTNEEGAPVSLQLTGSDDDLTLGWSATGLPPGLSLGLFNGLVSGNVGAAGTYPVVVKLTDQQSGEGTLTFTWTVTDSHPSIGAILPRSDAENTAVSRPAEN